MTQHPHLHPHGDAGHAHSTATAAVPAAQGGSLLMASAWQRVLGALALMALLWLAVAWAVRA